MSVDSKQLHNLSRIYSERVAPVTEGAGKDIFKKGEIKGTTKGKKPGDIKLPDISGGKKIQAEGVGDTVKTVMDKGSNFVKNNPVGKVLGKVVAPVKSTDGGSNRKSATAASQKAKGLRTEALGGVPGDGYIGHPRLNIKNPISPPKKTTNKSGNKGLAGKLGNRASQTSDAMREEKMAKKDYDGDGKVESSKDEYFGSKDKAIKKAMGKKIKEGFSDWRQDLSEYDQIPLTDKKRNEKISEKNVKNTVKINPEMNEEVVLEGEKDACYHKVKSRYSVWPSAYASGALVKCRRVGAKNWGNKSKKEEFDILSNFEFEIISEEQALNEGYQRNPEKGEEEAKKADKRSAKQKRMDDPKRGINSPAFKKFMADRGM